jgi:lipopolysaccharide export system permease protein
MAQRALLRETGIGPILYLSNGNVQRINTKTGEVDIVYFDRTAINIDEFNRDPADPQLEMTERFVGELFNPDLTRQYDRQNARALIGEGHGRLASPLYAVAYVLIGILALIGGPYNRRGYAVRIVAACAAVGALRMVGYILQGEASKIGQYWIIYAAPGAAIFAASLTLTDVLPLRRARDVAATSDEDD